VGEGAGAGVAGYVPGGPPGVRLFLLLSLLSIFAASIPMLTFLLIVWFMDRHDREPLWLFFLTFLWGACGAVCFALVGNETLIGALGYLIGPENAEQFGAVMVAPIVEEPMKAMVLFAVMFSRHFDNATDGFVYGAAAGLGFGMTENCFYFLNVASQGDLGGWLFTVFVRTFFSAVMHACSTSCVGAMLGFARFRGVGWKIVALPIGFGVAMSIHALWNGMLTMGDITADMSWMITNFGLFILEFCVLVSVFQLALWEERATIRRELADEVRSNLLPLAHAKNAGSWFRRSSKHWVPAGVPHGQYVKALTTLALRKHQARNASKGAYGFYSEEVVRLRREVAGLLALAAK
jgi:RsiW-degrading membrane proteinase PrsW (M82 family)